MNKINKDKPYIISKRRTDLNTFWYQFWWKNQTSINIVENKPHYSKNMFQPIKIKDQKSEFWSG